MASFVKIQDPNATSTSRIIYFSFLGRKQIVVGNSAGILSIFEFTNDKATQIFKYKLDNFTKDRDILTYGTKSLSEKYMAFISCNYSIPGQPVSTIHLLEVDPHKTAILPFKTISTENLDPKCKILTSVNCDFHIGNDESIPKVIAFVQNSENLYEFDLNGGMIECKTANVGMKNLRCLSYYENCLLGIDSKLQILEISKMM